MPVEWADESGTGDDGCERRQMHDGQRTGHPFIDADEFDHEAERSGDGPGRWWALVILFGRR
jgi:hypothetical protein